MTFNVSFPELGVYNLDLDFYNTLGPSEQLFVSGNGTLLDPILVFESAMISVVPEPAMSLFVSACLLFRCRASACRQARS